MARTKKTSEKNETSPVDLTKITNISIADRATDYETSKVLAGTVGMPMAEEEVRHVFIDLDTGVGAAIVVNFNGTPISLSFIPNTENEPDSVDILVHHKGIQRNDRLGKKVPQQKAVLYNGGHCQNLTGTKMSVLMNRRALSEA